jgi:hypothetical protein
MKKAKYNVEVLDGFKMIKNCKHLLPNSMFVYSKEDTFINFQHCIVNKFYFRGCFSFIMGIKASWKLLGIIVVKGLLNLAN